MYTFQALAHPFLSGKTSVNKFENVRQLTSMRNLSFLKSVIVFQTLFICLFVTVLYSPFTTSQEERQGKYNFVYLDKGQLISKGNFGVFNFLQKANEQIRLCYYNTSV
jgi:hypothetical protein